MYEFWSHLNVTYKGIPCQKSPYDYVVYQMLLNIVRPDLIIEIGTNKGGSALYFADLMFDWQGKVHTIDINPITNIWHPGITFFNNGFENYDLENTKQFKKIMVIDDGSHTYEHVRDSLKKFYPIVSKNSYFIVEDTSAVPGAKQATEEFIKSNSDFMIDKYWSNFF